MRVTENPAILILGSRHDFSCDYVVAKLRSKGASYLRLNTEDLPDWKITLNPSARTLHCDYGEQEYVLTPDSLKSIWFRRACYPRDYGQHHKDIESQIASSQWSAFLRNLIVYEECFWMNNPSATYKAEQKGYQLYIAAGLGFNVPKTLFSNDPNCASLLENPQLIIKGIDTVIGYRNGFEHFAFAKEFSSKTVLKSRLKDLPVTMQTFLEPKRDLRVTVVGDRVYAAEILQDGRGVVGDWRSKKTGIAYSAFDLPRDERDRCIMLTSRLGLAFGGIDLALTADGFEFLEINPTGEWAWLVDSAGLPIDEAISDALIP